MSFLTGERPPRTDLEIILDFLFDAVEGWSGQFRTQETAQKMYLAAQAFQRLKASQSPAVTLGEVRNGEEEGKAHEEGREEDAVLKEQARELARARMAKARAKRAENIAARKAASGKGA